MRKERGAMDLEMKEAAVLEGWKSAGGPVLSDFRAKSTNHNPRPLVCAG